MTGKTNPRALFLTSEERHEGLMSNWKMLLRDDLGEGGLMHPREYFISEKANRDDAATSNVCPNVVRFRNAGRSFYHPPPPHL